ncbi:SpaA isopeptide-forming pilin-related protein [Amycolatopsis sp. NPDC005961]|uniref:SpaA isopeptide-forming pilin-related protein n=1 Tax=Amycolatopsis sp. NPDC005961 TaxID=3156720 RepID=UPI003401CDCB
MTTSFVMRSAGRRAAVLLAVLVTAMAALTGVFAAPAGAASGRIGVSVTFDKPSYGTGDEIHATVKLTNNNSGRATGLTVFQYFDPIDLYVPYGGWGALQNRPGLTIEAGGSFELTVSGHVRDPEQTTAALRGTVSDDTGFGVGSFDSQAPVTKVPGRATGIFYADRNGDGVLDGGEPLAGATLTLRYFTGSRNYTATSDAEGKFAFDLPAGDYTLGGDVVDGWLVRWQTVRITPDTPDLLVRGAPPLNGALTASLAFTQDSYQPGDLAHLTVTLANSGSTPLTGIVAACNRIGDGYLLDGNGPGWGDLVWNRGVTIAAGETRTFDVSETMPQASFDRGKVVAACDFGYSEVDIENHANARAQASVPGGQAVVEGTIGHVDDNGEVTEGLAGTEVVLVSDQHCPVAGRQTTDGTGHFLFEGVAPGPEYRLYFLTPAGWKTKYENPTGVEVHGPPANHYAYRIAAEEGDAPAPEVPVNPADCG